MPNGNQSASRGGDPRTAREKIADVLIPRHCCFARGAFFLGDDSILLRYLPTPPECGESPIACDTEGTQDSNSPSESERHSADLLPFSPLRPR
jgi:hypothetical protein